MDFESVRFFRFRNRRTDGPEAAAAERTLPLADILLALGLYMFSDPVCGVCLSVLCDVLADVFLCVIEAVAQWVGIGVGFGFEVDMHANVITGEYLPPFTQHSGAK